MNDGPSPHQASSFRLVPLRDTVVFPRAVCPVTMNRAPRVDALEHLSDDELIVLLTQREANKGDVSWSDLYDVGVTAKVLKVAAVVHPTQVVVIFLGMERVRALPPSGAGLPERVNVERLQEILPTETDPEFIPLTDNIRALCAMVVAASPFLPNELIGSLQETRDPSELCDLVASILPSLSTSARQTFLETLDVGVRVRRLNEELVKEVEHIRIRKRIQSEVEKTLGKAQEEFFLREQLKAIQHQLGEIDPAEHRTNELKASIESCGMPDAVRAEAERELRRLTQIPQASAEYTVASTYLDWMISLPWKKSGAALLDVAFAERALDEDHFDLQNVKERIVEYLAVQHLRRDMKGPILCFVGPPGVGKTSVGKSIARACGRQFIRVSLGGIQDEAELRGHRRTYIGALPGQIISGMRRAGTNDPVFMLDEIDKLGKDFRGDPAAALMEVLDPEQNAAFRDHYLDVPFDLSRVLFITTANVLDAVPRALLDRMEVLELPGYTEAEKLQIARRYLVPRQVKEHGLDADNELSFENEALAEIIRSYTREAGVRNLEREIGALCRKHARNVAASGRATLTVTRDVVRELLGAPRFHIETELASRTKNPGVAVGVAWTPEGGDILFVEAARMPRDRGEVTLTGQLGNVMQESAKAALTWVRAHGESYGIASEAFKSSDLHLHVPAGGVAKDGPSAGLVMVVALVSLFTAKPARPYVALTGEITLSGNVLAVGGLKEKLLAAKRSGVREFVLPLENEARLREEASPELREQIQFHFVSTIEQALLHAFDDLPRRSAW